MGLLPGHRQLSIYIEPELHEQLKLLAKKSGLKMYEIVSQLVKVEVDARLSAQEKKLASSFAKATSAAYVKR